MFCTLSTKRPSENTEPSRAAEETQGMRLIWAGLSGPWRPDSFISSCWGGKMSGRGRQRQDNSVLLSFSCQLSDLSHALVWNSISCWNNRLLTIIPGWSVYRGDWSPPSYPAASALPNEAVRLFVTLCVQRINLLWWEIWWQPAWS